MTEIPDLNSDQQENLKQNIIRDAELLRGGATINSLGNLVVTEAQLETFRQEMDEDLSKRTSQEIEDNDTIDNKPETESSAEYTTEKIVDLLKDLPIIAATHSNHERKENMNQVAWGFGFGAFYNDKIRNPNAMVRNFGNTNAEGTSGEAFYERAVKSNVPELVTFEPKHDRGTAVLTYETAKIPNDKYSQHHRDLLNRPGNTLRYKMTLPIEEAKKLCDAMIADPDLVHRFTDVLMLEHFGMDEEEWAKIRPDYDDWRKEDGGELKMLFRTDLSATQGKVVKY